ncbi:MAG: 6-pyruvoyl tetrahydrobiopterin synthase [Deltaproteobacteria bacterium]|nr:6-pyruvoyl tetrahydrobiopterin synthase [Deltaproteobacteria bacterium]
MFTLCIKDSISAAHKLEDYHGQCEELHGHNFIVEALFDGEKLSTSGMVIDFKILKNYLHDVLKSLDHTYINDIPFFKQRASSSEYIAMYIYGELKKMTDNGSVRLTEVKVWESEKAWASYHE